jgi:CBS domain-containing protein
VESLGWVRRDVVTVPSDMPAIAAFALMLNRGVSGAGVVDAAAMAESDADSPLLSSLSVSDIRVLHRAADFDALALPVADFLMYHYGVTLPASPREAAAAAAQEAQGAAESAPTEVAVAAAQVAAMEVSVQATETDSGATGGAAAAQAASLPSASAVATAMEDPLQAAAPSTPRLWLVSCAPEGTLLEVLQKMVYNSVHRVYITDAERRPLGVVTMSGAQPASAPARQHAKRRCVSHSHRCARAAVSDVLQLVAVDAANDPEGWLESACVAY